MEVSNTENRIDTPAKEPIVLNTSAKRIGNTVYTVRAIQSENAKETATEKLKRLILRHLSEAENY